MLHAVRTKQMNRLYRFTYFVYKLREAFFLVLMVAKMNVRAGAKKKYDSGELLSSADAP